MVHLLYGVNTAFLSCMCTYMYVLTWQTDTVTGMIDIVYRMEGNFQGVQFVLLID